MAEKFTLADGVVLHRWTDFTSGQEWACVAYDHGPHCRLCQKVDPVLDAMIQNALSGNFLLRAAPDGQFEGHVTEKGKRNARHLIETVNELGDMYRELGGGDDDDD